MGKKRSWFGFLKRLFICKAESTNKKENNRRKWCFGILKFNRYYHALESPKTKVNDHEEDDKQHTMALAIAMTAAAEAAVAAANAAAELARLVKLPQDLEMKTRTTAAIKIQSFYRAHLAWKALIGLRGVVKLQAVIRGQILRQRVSNKLKNTYRSKLHRIRLPTFDHISKIYKEKHHLSPRNDIRNDHFVEHTNHGFGQETSMRSNRVCKANKPRFRHTHHTEEHNSQSFRPQMLYSSRRHYRLSPDRSDDTSLPNSPVFPTYMATTESFMAKARSLSTPRQRLSFLDDGYCTHGSFGMPMLEPSSSFNGRMKGDYRHMHL